MQSPLQLVRSPPYPALLVLQHPNDPDGHTLAAENQRLRGELAATIAERDALAAFVNTSRFAEPMTRQSAGSERPPSTGGVADESSRVAMHDSATGRPSGPVPVGTAVHIECL